MTASIEFSGLTKRYGAVTAIDGVSFSVGPGETIALLGPSGCGKTTILRMIAGFDRPDSGTIRIGGQDMGTSKPYERNVGLLFQNYALFPHMTVAENVAYGLRHRGTLRADIGPRVEEMLALVRLPDFGRRWPDQLSGGQQQRVALARALATHPSVVLLDEPLSALDAKLRHDLRAELKQVLQAVGSTVIVVTHDQEEAMSLGERVFVMDKGALLQVGAPNDVYWHPNSTFVADFMGRTNWIQGTIEKQGEEGTVFLTRSGASLLVDAQGIAPGPADLCVRPESIELTASQSHSKVLTGRVIDIVLLGPIRQLLVEIETGERLVAASPNRVDGGFGLGDLVGVRLPQDACMVFSKTQKNSPPPSRGTK